MSLRIIRELWLAGNAGLLAALALAQPIGLVVMGIADVVCAVAWIMAIPRACRSHEQRWALAIAVFPLAMWGYIFWRHAEPVAAEPTHPAYNPRPTYRPPVTWAAVDPLAVRQAREVIAEAERIDPDW